MTEEELREKVTLEVTGSSHYLDQLAEFIQSCYLPRKQVEEALRALKTSLESKRYDGVDVASLWNLAIDSMEKTPRPQY